MLSAFQNPIPCSLYGTSNFSGEGNDYFHFSLHRLHTDSCQGGGGDWIKEGEGLAKEHRCMAHWNRKQHVVDREKGGQGWVEGGKGWRNGVICDSVKNNSKFKKNNIK